MTRNCDVCGEPMPPQTGRGGRRKRHPECSKRSKLPRSARRGPKLPPAAATTLREAVVGMIADANATGTPEAMAALSLADRIDANQEPGAAHATLVKELRAVLVAMRAASTPAEADPVDELRQRRERRANG